MPLKALIALMTMLSRPEGVIIFPLYLFVYFVHREHRKQILINFGTFIILLLAAKWTMQMLTPPAEVTGAQELGFLDKLSFTWGVGLLSHLLNIPIILSVYAMECFQNTLVFILFLVGTIVSARHRSAWLMYAVLVSFALAYAIMFADTAAGSYSHLIAIIKRMSNEKDYFVVNAFNKFDHQLMHGRYRLVLYPIFLSLR